MTPLEKAQELIDKFNDVEDLKGRKIIHFIIDAKQCALIAVEEMIKFEDRIVNQIQEITQLSGREFKDESRFWKQVKHEIEKL